MKIDENDRDEKLLCNIQREETKMPALVSGKIGKYDYLTDKEILPPDQNRVVNKLSSCICHLEKHSKNQ